MTQTKPDQLTLEECVALARIVPEDSWGQYRGDDRSKDLKSGADYYCAEINKLYITVKCYQIEVFSNGSVLGKYQCSDRDSIGHPSKEPVLIRRVYDEVSSRYEKERDLDEKRTWEDRRMIALQKARALLRRGK